ncbi:MAG: retroviral-like aspartic protease family protein [Muribaculaceae bacterium]|nr:retroviral-like aspartic protease family protein [Muribaculaceae bacterium]
MKKLLIAILLALASLSSFAQSADDKVGDMMNNSQWFELRDFLNTTTDSVTPFLKDFAEAMLAHFFNKPEEAVKLSSALINSGNLDLGNVLSVSQLMAIDMGTLGKNESAALMLTQIVNQTKQYLDSATIAIFDNQIERHKALSKYNPYRIVNNFGVHSVPMKIDTLTMVESQPPIMVAYLTDCQINGNQCDIRFDTGAGVNVISSQKANEMGLKMLNASMVAGGTRDVAGVPIAIADSICLGNVTIYDVPFLVLDIRTGHDTLDVQLQRTDIVIGYEVMNALRNVKLDFENSCLMVSDKSFVPAFEKPNMMIANGNQIVVQGNVNGYPMLIDPDCGDGSFGIFFANCWPIMNTFVKEGQEPRNALMGGSGGYDEIQIYKIDDVPLTIGSTTISIPQIDLSEKYQPTDDYQVRIGLKTFILNKSVSFDMERMIMSLIR